MQDKHQVGESTYRGQLIQREILRLTVTKVFLSIHKLLIIMIYMRLWHLITNLIRKCLKRGELVFVVISLARGLLLKKLFSILFSIFSISAIIFAILPKKRFKWSIMYVMHSHMGWYDPSTGIIPSSRGPLSILVLFNQFTTRQPLRSLSSRRGLRALHLSSHSFPM